LTILGFSYKSVKFIISEPAAFNANMHVYKNGEKGEALGLAGSYLLPTYALVFPGRIIIVECENFEKDDAYRDKLRAFMENINGQETELWYFEIKNAVRFKSLLPKIQAIVNKSMNERL
jgi:hypothetical protein